MRYILFVILFAGSVCGQALIEHAGAAAGGSVGGIGGKKLSDGITKVLNKGEKHPAKAAGPGTTTPLIEVGPGVPKVRAAESVPPPPPPPPARPMAVHKNTATPRGRPPVPAVAATVPLPPPPPDVTIDDLRNVTAGMNREEVLKLGQPASRITMFDEGHLMEIYRYMAKDETLGVVRLSDGAVFSVQIK